MKLSITTRCLSWGGILGLMLLIIGCSAEANRQKTIMPPKAEKIDTTLTMHGHDRVDPYYWLNDRENQQVIDYLNAENDYTGAMLKHTEAFQEKLFDEIVSRFAKNDESVPQKENGYYYFYRYKEDSEYPIHIRQKGSLEADEEVMLDVNELAKGFDYYRAARLSVSENSRLLAFGEDTLSRRIYTLRFKDLTTGEFLPDRIPNTTGSAVWASDNKTVFYASKDNTLRPHKIMRHVLGTDPSQDVEVWHESDNTFGTYVYKTKSNKYIVIGSYSTLSTEMKFIEANNPAGKFKTVLAREKNHEYYIDHYQDIFYIVTNDKAKNFRLMKTSVKNTAKSNWKEVIGHRDDVLLQDIEVFRNYLVVSERKNGLRQLRIIDQRTQAEHYLDFGEPAYLAYVGNNVEFDSEVLRYGYTSLTTPNSTYDYSMKSREKTLLKQEKVLGDFKPENYTTERIYVEARDGVKVPVSIVYRNGMQKNGNNPLLLYGYGSYGNSIDASFRSHRLSLLDRGFVFAIAHIRGGEEMGRHWYEDGKLLKKKNTFTDFIDCGRALVDLDYTNPDKLFAIGGSAGGLLMGAVINMAPELFNGVIAAVPFVDVVTTMLDESIPLTTGEYDEWGNPNIKEYYDYILSYSPYDNVEAKDYPSLLVTTGLHDSQVQYWEPAKWVAKLRDKKTDDNPLLLHTQMEAGHSGASGRFERYRETALEYAFLLNLLNVTG